jgi:uncharacterized protein (TIGR03067 family)
MRTHVLFALAAALMVAAGGPKKDVSREDAKRFQGTWAVVSVEVNGKPGETFAGTMKVVGGKYTFYSKKGKKQEEMHYRLDATRNPKTIDFTRESNPYKPGNRGDGNRSAASPYLSRPYMQGIYELKGDTLRLCLRAPHKGRPRAFTSRGQLFITLKRVKRERKP